MLVAFPMLAPACVYRLPVDHAECAYSRLVDVGLLPDDASRSIARRALNLSEPQPYIPPAFPMPPPQTQPPSSSPSPSPSSPSPPPNPSPPPPYLFPPPPSPSAPPFLPPTSVCGLFATLTDLREVGEWCNTDVARRVNGALCEKFFVVDNDGRYGRCIHDSERSLCKMEEPTLACAPPPSAPHPPPTRPAFYANNSPPKSPLSSSPSSSLPFVYETESTASPFISFVRIQRIADFENISITVPPKLNATAGPITSTYTKTFALSKGWTVGGGDQIRLPVFGLYANHSNPITIAIGYEASIFSIQHVISASPWTGPFAQADRISVVDRNHAVHLDYSYILLKHPSTVGPIILDVDGNVRWVADMFAFGPQALYKWGNMLVYGNVSKLQTLAFDATVGTVADYAHMGATFHHNIDPGKYGILLEMDIDIRNITRLESTTYEVSRQGALLQIWDLSSIMRSEMIDGGDDPSLFVVDGVDWCHQNAAAYWSVDNGASEDTLVMSCREQFVIGIGYHDKKIKWILGDSTKAWYRYPSLRKHELALTNGSLAPIGQHSVSFTSGGELMLFDNGEWSYFAHASMPQGIRRNYSAARVYRIDARAMTAHEAWTFDHGKDIVSSICSAVYEYGSSKMLLYSNDGGREPINSSDDKRYTRVLGLDGDDRVAFEYKFRKYSPFCNGAWHAAVVDLSNLMYTQAQIQDPAYPSPPPASSPSPEAPSPLTSPWPVRPPAPLPPSVCEQFNFLFNLRSLPIPEWCNENVERRSNKARCEANFVIDHDGNYGFCKHEVGACKMHTPTYVCTR